MQEDPSVTPEQRQVVQQILAAKSFYDVLGVSRDAGDSDIKSAYRKVGLGTATDFLALLRIRTLLCCLSENCSNTTSTSIVVVVKCEGCQAYSSFVRSCGNLDGLDLLVGMPIARPIAVSVAVLHGCAVTHGCSSLLL